MSMLSSYTKFDLYFTINLVAYIQHYKFVYPARENGDVLVGCCKWYFPAIRHWFNLHPGNRSNWSRPLYFEHQASPDWFIIHPANQFHQLSPLSKFHVFTDDAVSEGHILVDELKTISFIKAWMKKAVVYTCSPPVYGPAGGILFNGYSRPITWLLFSSGL